MIECMAGDIWSSLMPQWLYMCWSIKAKQAVADFAVHTVKDTCVSVVLLLLLLLRAGYRF